MIQNINDSTRYNANKNLLAIPLWLHSEKKMLLADSNGELPEMLLFSWTPGKKSLLRTENPLHEQEKKL